MTAPAQTSDRTHKALGWVVLAAFVIWGAAFLWLFARDLSVDCGWVG